MYIKCITFWLICEGPTKDTDAANKASTLCTGTKISPLVLGLNAQRDLQKTRI
jgi:hypothetical protein